MASWKFLFATLLIAYCAPASCLDIGRIFGFRAVKEIDAKSADEFEHNGESFTSSPEHTTTRRPLLSLPSLPSLPGLPVVQIGEHHDAVHKPTVKPPITLSFPALSLPQLPQLPQLKPRVKTTRTVFVEVTKRVTRHPVCMTVYGVKPPCLYPPHSAHSAVDIDDCGHKSKGEEDQLEGGDGIWDDVYEEEGLYIEPTAVVRMPESTALYKPLYDDAIEATEDDVESSESRAARYIEFGRRPIVETPIESAMGSESDIDMDSQHPRLLDQLMGRGKRETITKTLWVTKVQKVTDYRVTATLVAENCVPTDSKIPLCGHPPSHGHHQVKPHVVKPHHGGVHVVKPQHGVAHVVKPHHGEHHEVKPQYPIHKPQHVSKPNKKPQQQHHYTTSRPYKKTTPYYSAGHHYSKDNEEQDVSAAVDVKGDDVVSAVENVVETVRDSQEEAGANTYENDEE